MIGCAPSLVRSVLCTVWGWVLARMLVCGLRSTQAFQYQTQWPDYTVSCVVWCISSVSRLKSSSYFSAQVNSLTITAGLEALCVLCGYIGAWENALFATTHSQTSTYNPTQNRADAGVYTYCRRPHQLCICIRVFSSQTACSVSLRDNPWMWLNTASQIHPVSCFYSL